MSTITHNLFSTSCRLRQFLVVAILSSFSFTANSWCGEIPDDDPPPAYPVHTLAPSSDGRRAAIANSRPRSETYPTRQASTRAINSNAGDAVQYSSSNPPEAPTDAPIANDPFGNPGLDFFSSPMSGANWFHGSCFNSCCCPGQLWVRPELLLWRMQGYHVPALVTTSPVGTTRAVAGRLGQPTTTTLFGDETLANTIRPGGRIRLGYWFDPSQTSGVDVTYMGLASQQTNFATSSASNAILARPFFNVQPGSVGQDAEFVAYPGLLQGGIQVTSSTSFESMEVLYRHNLVRNQSDNADFLIGWRYNRLNDHLSIQDAKTSIAASSGIAIGTTIAESDAFNARNIFNGLEFGLTRDRCFGPWTFEVLAKVALGVTNVHTTINGQTNITVPRTGAAPDVSITPTGLLAQQTNSGARDFYNFSVIPEIGATLGYSVSDNTRLTLGYGFMYWTSVVRSGNLIDTQLNLSQLTAGGLSGPAHPTYLSNTNGLWAQGFNVGFHHQF